MTTFLASVRRRLWLERIGSRLPIALWLGAAVLMLGAFANLFIPVTTTLAAGVSCGILAVVLILSALNRPSVQDAALRADKTFVMQSLFTTAIESRLRSSLSAADRHVLERAQHAARANARRVRETWTAPSARNVVPVLIPVFIAMSLYAVEARDVLPIERAVDQPAEFASAAPSIEDTRTEKLAELRDALAELRTESQTRRPRDANDMTEAAAASGEPVASIEERMPEAQDKHDSNNSRPGRSTSGEDAGDARRDANASVDPTSAGFVDELERASIDIRRHGNEVSGTDAAASGYAETQTGPVSNVRVAAVPLPANASGWRTLTPAEIAYARRYLAEVDSRE